mmetsp:Transcript_10909/g.28700  ORF Transcript_10909/g.28700 Transcript_10909/m.28700 type:complete len:93 (+) Transcript_10909:450-728(+)
MQARVTRVLASNSLRCPRAPSILLGISATSGSFGSGARRCSAWQGLWSTTAALTVAALAAMCSAFRLLACRCTALPMPDRAADARDGRSNRC